MPPRHEEVRLRLGVRPWRLLAAVVRGVDWWCCFFCCEEAAPPGGLAYFGGVRLLLVRCCFQGCCRVGQAACVAPVRGLSAAVCRGTPHPAATATTAQQRGTTKIFLPCACLSALFGVLRGRRRPPQVHWAAPATSLRCLQPWRPGSVYDAAAQRRPLRQTW